MPNKNKKSPKRTPKRTSKRIPKRIPKRSPRKRQIANKTVFEQLGGKPIVFLKQFQTFLLNHFQSPSSTKNYVLQT